MLHPRFRRRLLKLRALIQRRFHGGVRYFRISGQRPEVRWRKNEKGQLRTIEEAVLIARKNGVIVPEDVDFVVAEPGELQGSLRDLVLGRLFQSARGPEVREHSDGRIYWHDHYNRFGKIPFQIHPAILTSDKAIVSVTQHEMHELSLLRRVFMASRSRTMDATDHGLQVSIGRPGNFHDQAGSAADRLVRQMRKTKT